MMYPWFDKHHREIEHKMIGWMEKARSDVYWGEPTETGEERSIILPGHEPEIVWFPKTKSLCIQSHPEFIPDVEHAFVKYTNSLIKEYILAKM